MTSTLSPITIDCGDPYRLASFWAEVFAVPMDPEDRPGDDDALLTFTDGTPSILFVQVPEPKTVKNRVHFDLQPQDRTQGEEIERLTGLGAAAIADHRRSDGGGWLVMTDPEGHEFCVEISAGERPIPS